jgi:hypothetical protein
MKTCPTCKRTYDDTTLTYCLDDGSVLVAANDPGATLQLPNPRNTDPPATRAAPQSTILAQQPPNLYPPRPPQTTEVKHGVWSWLVIALVLTVIVMFAAVVLLGVLLYSKSDSESTRVNSNTNANGRITRIEASPEPSPSATKRSDGWGPRHDQAAINEGTRLTFYPGSTPEQCQADCDANSKCRAYTYIRPGAYKPSDPPMCYLMAEAKTLNPSPCCISAIKED